MGASNKRKGERAKDCQAHGRDAATWGEVGTGVARAPGCRLRRDDAPVANVGERDGGWCAKEGQCEVQWQQTNGHLEHLARQLADRASDVWARIETRFRSEDATAPLLVALPRP